LTKLSKKIENNRKNKTKQIGTLKLNVSK